MTRIARLHTLFGLCFAIAGMALGIYMASSHDHGQHVTHAHVLLLGSVFSVIYGAVYRLWVPDGPSKLARLQLWLHLAGTLLLVVGLFVLYGNVVPPPQVEPVLGVASIAVLASAVLMLAVFVRAGRAARAAAPRTATAL